MDRLIITDGRKQWTMLMIVCFGAFMANLDASIVNVCLPTISTQWDLSPSIVSLIVLAYLLFETAPIMAFGKLGDLFGPRRIFLSGFGLFTLSSLACGLAASLWQLVALRAVQGIGGAMIFAVMLSFAALYIEPEKRGRGMGFITMSAALGVAVGPTVGGVITHFLGWRYVFFVNVPLGVAAILIGLSALPREHPQARDRRFDHLGAIYQTLFLLCLIFAMNQEQELGWTSLPILCAVVAGILSGILFVRRELRITYPILNLGLLANRDTLLSTVNFCLSMMMMGGILFIMPFYLQDIRDLNVTVIGMIMSAISFGQFLGPYSGYLGDRVGHKKVALAGVILGLVALVFFVLMDFGQPLWWVILAMILFGISQGLNRAPNIQLIMASVPPELKATAASITSLMRSLGLVLGVVTFETTFSRFIPASISLDVASLRASGVSPEVLHNGFEATLLVGLIVSLIMVALIAAVDRKT